MSVDEQKFGELIGTVNALSATVSDMKAAIMPAIKEVRTETASYREEAWRRQKDHDEKDAVVHAVVADLADWMRGDGSPENPGAKRQLNAIVANKGKIVAMMTGLAFGVGFAGHKVSEKFSDFIKLILG